MRKRTVALVAALVVGIVAGVVWFAPYGGVRSPIRSSEQLKERLVAAGPAVSEVRDLYPSLTTARLVFDGADMFVLVWPAVNSVRSDITFHSVKEQADWRNSRPEAASIIYNTEDGQVAVYGTHCEAETCARWDAVFREGLTIYQVGWSLPSARAMGMQEFLDQTCVVWVAGLDVPECDSWAGALRLEEVYPGFY